LLVSTLRESAENGRKWDPFISVGSKLGLPDGLRIHSQKPKLCFWKAFE
jgi:hypothetical protein